jgi:hypothetical protein
MMTPTRHGMLRACDLPFDASTKATPATAGSRRPTFDLGEQRTRLREVSIMSCISEKCCGALCTTRALGIEMEECEVVACFLLPVLGDEIRSECHFKCRACLCQIRPNTDTVLQAVSEVDKSVSIAGGRRLPPPRECPAMISHVAVENGNVRERNVLSLPDLTLESRYFKLLLGRHCSSTSLVGPTPG